MRALYTSTHGGVLLETAIAVPIILFLFFAIAEFIFLGYAYLAINHVARETALSTLPMSGAQSVTWNGASVPVESDVNKCYPADFSRYQPQSGYEAVCPQIVLTWRLKQLFSTYKVRIQAPSVQASVVTDPSSKTVIVQVQALYHSYFPLFNNTPLRARVESDYAI